LVVFAAPCLATVDILGVITTGEVTVNVDSVRMTGDTTQLFLTTGWGGAPEIEDSLTFFNVVSWPRRVNLYCLIEGSPNSQVFNNPVSDSWYIFQSPLPSPPAVKFVNVTGIEEQSENTLSGPGLVCSRTGGRSHLLRVRCPQDTRWSLDLFAADGRFLGCLCSGTSDRVVRWSGTDAAGNALPAGVYLCRLVTEHRAVAVKLVLTD
jgi:hypothetical protein